MGGVAASAGLGLGGLWADFGCLWLGKEGELGLGGFKG